MAERCYANLFEVMIGQIRQDDKANIILSKALSVLPKTELLQPLHNLLHRRRPAVIWQPKLLGRQS